jgi:DNA-binding response OmpR family regulator
VNDLAPDAGPPDITRIVCLEDSDADADIIERAVREASSRVSLTRVRRTATFLDAFESVAAGEVSVADGVILDLSLVDGSGFEVLRVVRHLFDRRELPVAVLSGGLSTEEMYRAYALGANVALTKPMRFREYVQKLTGLCSLFDR